ncbi:MAG: DUF3656 domain-containing U32 family peptidase [Caulobacteraceae bacterium]
MSKIELLAPAGSMEALVAAVESGADAVYLGGNKFNARAYAGNFDGDMLIKAVNYAHIRGVRIYITVNILLTDKELVEVLDYIRFLYYIGVDAVIVQDFALIKLIRDLFPDMEVHCSTQMTVHNSEGAKFYAELGVKRIVLARELPLQEVRNIIEKAGVDTEIFVHGALCVSYSGQCLMSSMIGGRSGNRGRCAQPCRKKYSFFNCDRNTTMNNMKGKHLLSTRDLNTYKRLDEILRSGVKSLKIEGRMKRPEYVAIVVKHYRDAIDRIFAGKDRFHSKEAEYELESAFNREFTEGYLFSNRNKNIVSIERPDNRGIHLGKVTGQKGDVVSILLENGFLNDGDGIEILEANCRSKGTIISGIRVKGKNVKNAVKGETAEIFLRDKAALGAVVNKTYDSMLNRKAREEYFPENRRKIHVDCKIFAWEEKYPEIQLADADGNSVGFTGPDKVEKAEKTGSSTEKIIEQLRKTGDTPYIIDSIDTRIGGDCYLPARLINLLRREALELLSEERAGSYKRNIMQFSSEAVLEGFIDGKDKDKTDNEIEYIAGIRDLASAESAVKAGADTLYILGDCYRGNIEADADGLMELCRVSAKKIFYVLPSITRNRELYTVERNVRDLTSKFGNDTLGLVVSNVGQLYMKGLFGINNLRINHSMNIFNAVTANHFIKEGADSFCISPELNLAQIKAVSSKCNKPVEAVVYGYTPVMTTEYCPVSLLSGDCKYSANCIKSNYGIIDEKGKVFRIIKLNSCRTQILNSDVLFVPEELDEIIKSGVRKLRTDFYLEMPEEIYEIVSLYKDYRNSGSKYKELIERVKGRGFTKGHFFRGVD